MKLWGGRFKKEESKIMDNFNKSIHIDKRLYYEDITGSIAHVKMLSKCNILTDDEKETIVLGLQSILEDIESGDLVIGDDYEDIHTFVEIELTKRIGELGKKLHTARSRNDQVAVDMKLYVKKNITKFIEYMDSFRDAIKNTAEKNPYIMPGYTHLQRAQIVTFKHHLMAYYAMFGRDKKRLESALEIMDESPLGCCALAGTTYNIDRQYTSNELKFKKPVDNFLDGVSDRDYIIELISCFSLIMMHLSRLSEELIIWNSKEFDFIQIDDEYTTGSSIMPQKKNPDGAELIRGKTGRVYGNLMSMLTTMKALPLSYNKDMQEDKELFFDSFDTTFDCIKIMFKMISTLQVKKENMIKGVKKGFLNATEVADYLVNKGMAFRDAHKVVGEIVLHCEDNDTAIEDLKLEELLKFSTLFDDDIYNFIDYEEILKKGIKKHI